MIWKFELPLLSSAEIFSKVKQFRWSDLKIWTGPFITSWNFLKNKAVLLKQLENLKYPYRHELNFGKKMVDFANSLEFTCFCKNKVVLNIWPVRIITRAIWTFDLLVLLQAGIFAKIRQAWWYHWKIELARLSQSKILTEIR